MKKYHAILILVAILSMVIIPVAIGEAVDADPVPGLPTEMNQLITKEVLGTLTGMVAIAMGLTQGVKMLFMRNAQPETVRMMAFFMAAIVTVISKLIFSMPFDLADVIVMPINALIVWWASMKGYEQMFGLPSTPAGRTLDRNLH